MKRKVENQAMKEWEIKNQGGAYQKRNSKPCLWIAFTKTTLCQNRRNERKKKTCKANLAENRFGCSSHVFPFMEISSIGFSFACIYPKYYKYV
jgi:hypothetical protein